MRPDQALEKLLTEANESAKAFAQFGGDMAAVRMRLLTARYAEVVSKLVEKLETDSVGRILRSETNATIQKAIAEATGMYKAAAGSIGGVVKTAGEAMSASIQASTKTLRAVLKSTNIDEIAIEAFAADAQAYGAITVRRGAMQIATSLSEQILGAVNDAIVRFEGNKDDLIGRLFSPQGIEHFRTRNAEMAKWAQGMDGKAMQYIDDLKAGAMDIDKIRTAYRKELGDYIEQRKAFLQAGQQPSLFDNTALETKTITEVKGQIIQTHQDSVYRTAQGTLPEDTLWVNAKNTGYADNCIDAMNADPMSLEDWRSSPFGLPRSPSRDCGVYCECILFPVTPRAGAGVDISDPMAQGVANVG